MEDIRFERCLGGYIVWDGRDHLANLATGHQQGLTRNGAMIYEAQPRADWSLHWTRPALPVDLIARVLAALPQEA